MLRFPLFTTGLAVAAGATFVLQHYGLTPCPAPSDRGTVFGTLAQVAGTMLGFMLAALAIVASISETDLVKRMRSTGHYDSLLQNLFFGALLFLACAVLSLLTLLGVELGEWLAAALFGLHIAALWELLIVGWQFWLTLRNLAPRDDAPREMPPID
jgi:hypothetical protein